MERQDDCLKNPADGALLGAEEKYKSVYTNCMAGRGHKVIR